MMLSISTSKNSIDNCIKIIRMGTAWIKREAPGGGSRFVVLCGYTRYRRDIDMANIIAVIWDCDKTLIDGYMPDYTSVGGMPICVIQ